MSNKQTTSAPFDRAKHLAGARSKVSKKVGGKMIRADDGRSKQSRRFQAIVKSTIELAGNHNPPEVTEQLAKQYASLVLRQERHLANLLDGKGRNDVAFVRLINASNRTLRLLGLLTADNGNDMDDGQNALEKYAERKRGGGNGTKRDKRRYRLVK